MIQNYYILVSLFVLISSVKSNYCYNSNVPINEKNINYSISQLSYYSVNATLQGQIDTSTNILQTVAFYSLTTFPGAVQFSCPAPRFKGFAYVNSPFIPISPFVTIFLLNVLSMNSTILSLGAQVYSVNCFFVQTANSSRCYFIPSNINTLIPDNCVTVGQNININIPVTYTNFTFNSTIDVASSLPCSVSKYDCGFTVQPLYNTTCCYMNGTAYNGTKFYSTSAADWNSITGVCSQPRFWDEWKIAVIVLAVLAVILLLFLALSLICRPSHGYMTH